MDEYQERVIEEKNSLDEKIERLDIFLRSSSESLVATTFKSLPSMEQSLLIQQRIAMGTYSTILAIRASNF